MNLFIFSLLACDVILICDFFIRVGVQLVTYTRDIERLCFRIVFDAAKVSAYGNRAVIG